MQENSMEIEEKKKRMRKQAQKMPQETAHLPSASHYTGKQLLSSQIIFANAA